LILLSVVARAHSQQWQDACNRKSNQQNLGTINCSNLCTEIVEYTAPDEVAVCNLASVGLPMFVGEVAGRRVFSHDKLREVTKVITRNLNKVIDTNCYPVPEARRSNMRHRPIGMGIQVDCGLLFPSGVNHCDLMPYFRAGARRRLHEAADAVRERRGPPAEPRDHGDDLLRFYFAAVESSMELTRELGP
jgi:hypothetical protein